MAIETMNPAPIPSGLGRTIRQWRSVLLRSDAFPTPADSAHQTTLGPAFAAGIAAAAREQQSPSSGIRGALSESLPIRPHGNGTALTEEEAHQMAEVAEAGVKIELGRLLDRWYGEHLPASLPIRSDCAC